METLKEIYQKLYWEDGTMVFKAIEHTAALNTNRGLDAYQRTRSTIFSHIGITDMDKLNRFNETEEINTLLITINEARKHYDLTEALALKVILAGMTFVTPSSNYYYPPYYANFSKLKDVATNDLFETYKGVLVVTNYWPSSFNRTKMQRLTSILAAREAKELKTIILSHYVKEQDKTSMVLPFLNLFGDKASVVVEVFSSPIREGDCERLHSFAPLGIKDNLIERTKKLKNRDRLNKDAYGNYVGPEYSMYCL